MTGFVRVAESLNVLLREVDARFPSRNRASDGALGNADHAATMSDHNPNAAGVVCARDITHDPASGCDGALLGELFRVHPHPDVKYVIFHPERRMWSAYPTATVPAFTWRPYGGPAASELHVSVGVGRDGQSVEPYDDTDSWFTLSPQPQPQPQPVPVDPTGTESEPVMVTAVLPDGTTVLFAPGVDSAVWTITRHPDGTYSTWENIGGLVRGDIDNAAIPRP